MKTLQAFKKLPRLLFAGRFAYDFDGMPLMTGRLPLRKRLNLLKCGVDQLRRGERPWAMPPAVQVEPTNRCNLSCPLCPTGTTVGKRPAGAMSRETFRRILEQMGDHLVAAVLYSWGEPFLNRDLPGMISDCTARGILSVTSTNGHFLQTQEEALAVVDSGLSALVIALDGSTQEIYQSYRHGGDMEKVKRCAEMVERAKALRRSATPYTNLRTVVTSANVDDLPNLERLARDLGVNMYSCKSLGCLVKSPAMTQYDSADERYSRFAGPKRKKPFRCNFPFRQPVVFWDGTVAGCEFDYQLSAPWGKIGEQPFRRIWDCSSAQNLRHALRTDGKIPAFCSLCPYRDSRRDGSVLRCKELRPAGDC